MLRIVLTRHFQTAQATYGSLIVQDGAKVLFSSVCLELPWKDNQARVSCIPEGEYDIVLEYSPAFKIDLWEIKGVPGRSECKIHTANYARQLNGCIAPGKTISDIDTDGIFDVTSSEATRKLLHAAMGTATKARIRIVNAW